MVASVVLHPFVIVSKHQKMEHFVLLKLPAHYSMLVKMELDVYRIHPYALSTAVVRYQFACRCRSLVACVIEANNGTSTASSLGTLCISPA